MGIAGGFEVLSVFVACRSCILRCSKESSPEEAESVKNTHISIKFRATVLLLFSIICCVTIWMDITVIIYCYGGEARTDDCPFRGDDGFPSTAEFFTGSFCTYMIELSIGVITFYAVASRENVSITEFTRKARAFDSLRKAFRQVDVL